MTDNYNPDFNREYFGSKVGALYTDGPQRSGGKKAFEWSFRYSAVDKKPIGVDVYLMPGMIFRASCPELKGEFLEHSDLKILHSLTERALLDRVDVLSDIVWEDWYQVEVSGANSDFKDSPHSSLGANLKINVINIKRGIHPRTGLPVTIGQHGCIAEFPSPTTIDMAEPDQGDFYKGNYRAGRSRSERSYIPATPENTAALRDILGRMGELRSRLAEVLNHQEIQKTLTDSRKLLPVKSLMDEPVEHS